MIRTGRTRIKNAEEEKPSDEAKEEESASEDNSSVSIAIYFGNMTYFVCENLLACVNKRWLDIH